MLRICVDMLEIVVIGIWGVGVKRLVDDDVDDEFLRVLI